MMPKGVEHSKASGNSLSISGKACRGEIIHDAERR